MVESSRPGVYDGLYGVLVALEVRGQYLDGALGDFFFYRPYGGGEDGCPPVGQLVTVYRSYDGVPQAHLLRGVGDTVGFVQVQFRWLAGQDGAEAAGSGTDVTQNHERGGPVVPALTDVRAAGLLADGVERESAHGLFDLFVGLAAGDAGFQPVGAAVVAALLLERQVFCGSSIGRGRHGTVFPAMAHLESARAVVENLQVHLSASHRSPLS